MTNFSGKMIQVLDKYTQGTRYSGAGIGRLLDEYETLVTLTEEGLGLDEQGVTYEFDNDLYIRILLFKVVTDPSVSNEPDIEPIVTKIHALDGRLKASPRSNDFTEFCKHNSLDIS